MTRWYFELIGKGETIQYMGWKIFEKHNYATTSHHTEK